MTNVQIQKMYIVNGKENADGERIVAAFDFVARGFRLCGVGLARRADLKFAITGVHGKSSYNHPIAATIVDDELWTEVTDRAGEVFVALSGSKA